MTLRVFQARWVLPITSPAIEHGAVAVDGSRIAWVGRADEAPPGARIDLGESVLMPGLVNVHSHLELTSMRGFLEELEFRRWIVHLVKAREASMTAERAKAAARIGIAEGLLSGITTFGDVTEAGRSLGALKEMGVRGIVWQEVFGPSDEQCQESLEGLKSRVATLRGETNDMVQLGVSPHAPYSVSDSLFAATARYAIEESLPLTVHIAESQAEWDFVVEASGDFANGHRARGLAVIRRGDSPVEMLRRTGVMEARPLLIHAIRVSERDRELIADSGATVAHCPASNAKLGHGVAPLMDFLIRDIGVGLGTDSVASNNRMDLLDECRIAIMMQRAVGASHEALSAAQALELATLGGAKVLGLGERIGSLEVGKEADITAFALEALRDYPVFEPENALVFGAGGRKARLTMVAGRELVRDGRLETDVREDLELLKETGRALERSANEARATPSR